MSHECRSHVVASRERKSETVQAPDEVKIWHQSVKLVTEREEEAKLKVLFCQTDIHNEGLEDRNAMTKCEQKELSENLFLWSTQQRKRVVPQTGPFVQTKALIFHKEFAGRESDFTPSADWIYK